MSLEPIVISDENAQTRYLVILGLFLAVFFGWTIYTQSSKNATPQAQLLADTTVIPIASPAVATPEPSPTIEPTITPSFEPQEAGTSGRIAVKLISCKGPDGKTTKVTQTDCDNLWAFWNAHPPTGVGGANISVPTNTTNSDKHNETNTTSTAPSPSAEVAAAPTPTDEPQPAIEPSIEPSATPNDEPNPTDTPTASEQPDQASE